MWEQKGVAWPRATRCIEPALTKRGCQEPGPERLGGLILRSWPDSDLLMSARSDGPARFAEMLADISTGAVAIDDKSVSAASASPLDCTQSAGSE